MEEEGIPFLFELLPIEESISQSRALSSGFPEPKDLQPGLSAHAGPIQGSVDLQ